MWWLGLKKNMCMLFFCYIDKDESICLCVILCNGLSMCKLVVNCLRCDKCKILEWGLVFVNNKK